MKKFFGVVGFFIICLIILGWNMISSTVSESDIQLNATLKPISPYHYINDSYSGSPFGYQLDVILNNKTMKPLISEHFYTFDIYPYIGGNYNANWEIFDPTTGEVLKDAKGFSFGSNGVTEIKASKKLRDIGIPVNDNYCYNVDGLPYGPLGFSYIKDKFPIGVRFYILKTIIL